MSPETIAGERAVNPLLAGESHDGRARYHDALLGLAGGRQTGGNRGARPDGKVFRAYQQEKGLALHLWIDRGRLVYGPRMQRLLLMTEHKHLGAARGAVERLSDRRRDARNRLAPVDERADELAPRLGVGLRDLTAPGDRKSTRLNSSHDQISYAVFCLKKK